MLKAFYLSLEFSVDFTCEQHYIWSKTATEFLKAQAFDYEQQSFCFYFTCSLGMSVILPPVFEEKNTIV